MATLDRPEKQQIGPVHISPTSYAEASDYCGRWIEDARQGKAPNRARYVCVTSAHGVVESSSNPVVRSDINGADMATPDGMPIVWALRSFGHREQNRVYGPDLTLELCRRAEIAGHKLYFYGASQDTLNKLQANLQAKFPRLKIVGTFSPPFRKLTPEEDRDIIQIIQDSGCELVFVGLSTPKQERWMAEHRQAFPGLVMIGVGAAFDFHAGKLRQAPAWMQRRGLEWFFRLCMEPRRLWQRYVLVTPRFLPLWWMQKLGFQRFQDSPTQ